jgi:hypothetical protein
VAWLLPELEPVLGVVALLNPDDLDEESEADDEDDEDEDDEPLVLLVVPPEVVVSAFALPGSMSATTPVATTLTPATPAVMPRTLARPRSRAALAWSSCSRFMLLHNPRAVDVASRLLLCLL